MDQMEKQLYGKISINKGLISEDEPKLNSNLKKPGQPKSTIRLIVDASPKYSGLLIRERPSIGSSVKYHTIDKPCVLKNGEVVKHLETVDDDWCKIESLRLGIGYVMSKYVRRTVD